MHPSIMPDLKENGFEAHYCPDIVREELKEVLPQYEGIIIRSKTTMDADMLDAVPGFKFIARAGAGTDKIDEAYCERKGIIILNAPEGNRDALGEHALGLLLGLLNKIHTADREIRNLQWDREGNRGTEVKEKVVGIIGYGNMGSAFAQRLAGFECTVLAYDKYKDSYGDQFARESNLESLFIESDIISFHVPLTHETQGLYNYDFFQRFRKNVFVLNTARGPILPLADLIRLLDEGKILGAALDVLESEKIKKLDGDQKVMFENLIKRNNVILTPHVGGWSHESYKRINDTLVRKIKSLYNL